MNNVALGQIEGCIAYKNIPKFAQMRGGVHTELGNQLLINQLENKSSQLFSFNRMFKWKTFTSLLCFTKNNYWGHY